MINLIVAYSKNYVIGNNGKIPWKIPHEQLRFKNLTFGHIVIMGRRTFEEIGTPLPNRKILVVSNTLMIDTPTIKTVSSLNEAINTFPSSKIFIAGGAKLYEEALPLVDTMYITVIDKILDGDTFFPQFDKSLFEKTFEKRYNANIPYTYYTYKRKK